MGIVFGLVILGFGIFGLQRSLRLRTKGRFTIGTVTKIQYRGRSLIVFVSFDISKKQAVTFEAGAWRGINTPLYKIGNQVPVLYDPNNPTDAVVYNIDSMWLIPLSFFGLGAFVIYTELTRK